MQQPANRATFQPPEYSELVGRGNIAQLETFNKNHIVSLTVVNKMENFDIGKLTNTSYKVVDYIEIKSEILLD